MKIKNIFLALAILVCIPLLAETKYACIAVSANSQFIVTTHGNIAKIWNIKEIEDDTINRLTSLWRNSAIPLFQIDHESPILSVEITPDNKYIITNGAEKARIWRLKNGNLLARL